MLAYGVPYSFVYKKLTIVIWAKSLTLKKNAITLIVYRYREQKGTATMSLCWLLTYGREWDGSGNGKRLRWVWLRSVDSVIMSRSGACGAAIRLICILNLPHPSRITQAERLYPICIPQPTTLWSTDPTGIVWRNSISAARGWFPSVRVDLK